MSNIWEEIETVHGQRLSALQFETSFCICGCINCERLPINLHVLRCDCRLCNECFEHARCDSVSVNCPAHKRPTDLNEVKSIELKKEDIMQTAAYCSNRGNGCTHVDIIENLNHHEEQECCFCYVKCLLKCGEEILLKDVANHFSVVCSHRIVKCDYCKRDTMLHKMEDHHKMCTMFQFLKIFQLPQHEKDCEQMPELRQFKEMAITFNKMETQTEPKFLICTEHKETQTDHLKQDKEIQVKCPDKQTTDVESGETQAEAKYLSHIQDTGTQMKDPDEQKTDVEERQVKSYDEQTSIVEETQVKDTDKHSNDAMDIQVKQTDEQRTNHTLSCHDALISTFVLKCPNKDKGCPAEISSDKVMEHLRSCRFAVVGCPLDGKLLLKKDLIDHLKRECNNRIYKCPDCEEVTTHKNKWMHQHGNGSNPEAEVNNFHFAEPVTNIEIQKIEKLEIAVEEMKKTIITNKIYSKKLRKILRCAIKRRLEDIKRNVELSYELEDIREKYDISCKQMEKDVGVLKTEIEANKKKLSEENEELESALQHIEQD